MSLQVNFRGTVTARKRKPRLWDRDLGACYYPQMIKYPKELSNRIPAEKCVCQTGRASGKEPPTNRTAPNAISPLQRLQGASRFTTVFHPPSQRGKGGSALALATTPGSGTAPASGTYAHWKPPPRSQTRNSRASHLRSKTVSNGGELPGIVGLCPTQAASNPPVEAKRIPSRNREKTASTLWS